MNQSWIEKHGRDKAAQVVGALDASGEGVFHLHDHRHHVRGARHRHAFDAVDAHARKAGVQATHGDLPAFAAFLARSLKNRATLVRAAVGDHPAAETSIAVA